ncbi:hypothetical protein [Rickettsiella endosymbiont of Rhagonycha lignosa]|uniref:hypothetical protein n=1 Tax=Rickettsiella endosymbiont of Rhagonycha lignosa TaxID=3077937 RepID=UPI00313EC02E
MTGTSYISTNKTNPESSSNTKTTISFFVYADPGTSLYINGKFDYKFEPSAVSYRVDLQKNDYLSVTTKSNKIEVENFNDFAIDLEMTKDETTYGSHIKAKSKKSISIMSEKIFVSKTENTEENKETSSNTHTKISFFVYADSGTSLYINGKFDYRFEPSTVSYRVDLQKNDYLSIKTTSKKIEVENFNDFAIDLENRVGATFSSQIEAGKKKAIVVIKSDKFYVSKAEISFLVYAASGTSLYKNDVSYFEFKATNTSRDVSYRVALKRNDYLSVTTNTMKTNAENTNKINIAVENTNDFTLVLHTKETVSVEYIIEAGEKKTIPAMKPEKFYVSKKPGLFMKLEKGISVYLNNAPKAVYTFQGDEFICVTCKLKDDFLTVSKDTSMTVENQNIFDVQLQLKTSKVDENISKFSIASMHKIEKPWLKTQQLVYDKKVRRISTSIHIDKTVERITASKKSSKIKFKVYVLSSGLPEHMTLGTDATLQLTHKSSKGVTTTKIKEADKPIDFEGTEDSIFAFIWSFKLSPPEEGETDISDAISPHIWIPLLLVVESSNTQGSTNEKVAMIDANTGSFMQYFFSKDELLKAQETNLEVPKGTNDNIKDFIKEKDLQGKFLIIDIPIFIPKPESYPFRLTKILYQKISVLNLVKWQSNYKFYIECYEVSLFQTSRLEFKKIIEYAGERRKEAKTNDSSVNRISKIALPYPPYCYGDSNLWDDMYDSNDLLHANAVDDERAFRNFYSIMLDSMPSGGKVTMLQSVKVFPKKPVEGVDKYVEVALGDILVDYKITSALLSDGEISDLFVKYDVFALCLWDIKKSFVTRSLPINTGSGAGQDKTSQLARLYIKVNQGEVSVYKNRKFEYDLRKDDAATPTLKINEDYLMAVQDTRIDVVNQNAFEITLQFTLYGRSVYNPRILPQSEMKGILFQKNENMMVVKTRTNTNTSTSNTNVGYDIFGFHR